MNRRRYVVQRARNSPYAESITLAQGQVVSVGEEYRGKEPWVGWIRCETGTIKCWVPFQIIENAGSGVGIVKESYVATELNVEMGDVIEAERELNGWVWARKVGTTDSGWVPMDLLVEDSEWSTGSLGTQRNASTPVCLPCAGTNVPPIPESG